LSTPFAPFKYLFSVFTVFLCSLFLDITAQVLVINEFMAKNATTIQDEDGDYSDWIELYNTGNEELELIGWSLSDDINDLSKWTFPEVTLDSAGYILVFSSDKDRLDPSELHTNFKIGATGEALYLSSPAGVLEDQTAAVELYSDDSYGRVPDGAEDWIGIRTPSPSASNNRSNRLLFSHAQGAYHDAFALDIQTLREDTIYYTLNGEVPTEDSEMYTVPIVIDGAEGNANYFSEIPTSPLQNSISYKAWESPAEEVAKATIFRCASFSLNERTSGIYSMTFFVGDTSLERYSTPMISLITAEENLFSPQSGLFVPGENFDENNPQLSGNYFMTGTDWERPVHIEYFDHGGELVFSQDAGLRIHGGLTRHAAQKSLRLYARSEFGREYFSGQLLPRRALDKHKCFILRGTMGDWGSQTMIKDVLAQAIASPLDVDGQGFRAVTVFVNGEYWGVHLLRDRLDDRYIEDTQGVHRDSVQFWSWDNPAYAQLISFIGTHDITLHDPYQFVDSKMDIGGYIDYLIAELFLRNFDWPGNNTAMWRALPNGKWHWLLYDLDAGFGIPEANMLNHASQLDTASLWEQGLHSKFLFRSLLENKGFETRFIQRYQEALNEVFVKERMTAILDSIVAILNPEIEEHVARWNFPQSYNSWHQDLENDVRNFLAKRPCIVRKNLSVFFDRAELSCEPIGEWWLNDLGDNWNDLVILAPNPVARHIYILNEYSDMSNASIEILDIRGRLVYDEKAVDIPRYQKTYFNMSEFQSGIYVFRIKSEEYSGRRLFIRYD
jgi:hypothetical protein